MEQNLQRNGLVNLLVLLVIGVAEFATARYLHSLAGQVTAVFLGLAALVAAVSAFQMRLQERERLEQLEFDEVARGSGSEALFHTQESETFPARRSRQQFERFFVPAFTVGLLLLQAAGVFWLWRWLDRVVVQPLHQPVAGIFLLILLALVLFILGKYSAGLARLEDKPLLSPGAHWLLLGAYLVALSAVAVIFFKLDFPRQDYFIARALCVLLGLLALENAVTLVLEVYRPRVQGKRERLLYESRLVGLLSRPEGIFTTAAHALDYQFGFKVSETWFYKFLEKAFAWLLLAQLGLLLLSSCLVFVEVGEEALFERFGKPVGQGLIGPGLHLKLPWPIDKVYRFRTDEVHTFTVGHQHLEEEEEAHHEPHELTLWTVQHTKEEFLLLVASREPADTDTDTTGEVKSPPVRLLAASIPVQYQISDLRAWAYNHVDAEELLEHIGTREVVRYLVNADMEEVTSRGRAAASQEVRRTIQTRADALKLGVKIIYVGWQDLHPPVKVAGAYEEVVSAGHKREAALLEAQAHQAQTNALAIAAATNRIRTAGAESLRLAVGAQARKALFTNQIPGFRAAPDVYSRRAYLQMLTRSSRDARLYVLATTNTADVIQLNLEEKVREDLLNIAIPTPKPK